MPQKVGIGITDKSFKDCLEYAVSFNLIDKDFANCLSNNMKMRNSFSHKYNVPTTEELVSFYKGNRLKFDKHLAFMKSMTSTNIGYCVIFDS